MKRSFVRRLSLIGACTVPLAMTTALFAQRSKVEEPGRTTPPPDSQTDSTRENASERPNADRATTVVQAASDAPGAPEGRKLDDHTLAALILIGNQKEVALSRLAASRAQSPEVKQFAEEMSKAHGDVIKRLAHFAGAQERGQNAEKGTVSVKERGAERAAGQSGVNRDWQRYDLVSSPIVSFDRELAEQCLQGAEKFLGQQEGATFDRWFMTFQLVGHMGLRDKLLVAQRHATGEMRALVDQSLQTTDQHIRRAEQVMSQLAHAESGEQTSKRDAATKR